MNMTTWIVGLNRNESTQNIRIKWKKGDKIQRLRIEHEGKTVHLNEDSDSGQNVMVINAYMCHTNICLYLRELLAVISFITMYMTIKRLLSHSHAHFSSASNANWFHRIFSKNPPNHFVNESYVAATNSQLIRTNWWLKDNYIFFSDTHIFFFFFKQKNVVFIHTLWILRLIHFVAWKVLFHRFLRLYHFHRWQHNECRPISANLWLIGTENKWIELWQITHWMRSCISNCCSCFDMKKKKKTKLNGTQLAIDTVRKSNETIRKYGWA